MELYLLPELVRYIREFDAEYLMQQYVARHAGVLPLTLQWHVPDRGIHLDVSTQILNHPKLLSQWFWYWVTFYLKQIVTTSPKCIWPVFVDLAGRKLGGQKSFCEFCTLQDLQEYHQDVTPWFRQHDHFRLTFVLSSRSIVTERTEDWFPWLHVTVTKRTVVFDNSLYK